MFEEFFSTGKSSAENFNFLLDNETLNMCEAIVDRKLGKKMDDLNRYELTLTVPADEDNVICDLTTHMHKIVKSKMFKISEWFACIELTKNKVPHIHMYIVSEKTILKSRIAKLYPHVFHLSKVRNVKKYLEYMEKEKNNQEVINYCKEKKCSQFYSHAKKENIPEAQEEVLPEKIKLSGSVELPIE